MLGSVTLCAIDSTRRFVGLTGLHTFWQAVVFLFQTWHKVIQNVVVVIVVVMALFFVMEIVGFFLFEDLQFVRASRCIVSIRSTGSFRSQSLERQRWCLLNFKRITPKGLVLVLVVVIPQKHQFPAGGDDSIQDCCFGWWRSHCRSCAVLDSSFHFFFFWLLLLCCEIAGCGHGLGSVVSGLLIASETCVIRMRRSSRTYYLLVSSLRRYGERDLIVTG